MEVCGSRCGKKRHDQWHFDKNKEQQPLASTDKMLIIYYLLSGSFTILGH